MSPPLDSLPPQKRRLTLKQFNYTLRVQLGALLILIIAAGYEFHKQQLWSAAFLAAGVVAQIVILFSMRKQFHVAENGDVVYVGPQQVPHQLPAIVSIIVVFVVTAFVGLCSAFIVYLALTVFNTQLGWTICGAALLAVWLFVGYCWYRIFTEKLEVKPIAVQEHLEGVWPPSPSRTESSNEE